MAILGRPGLTGEQKVAVWSRWRQGESLSHIGRVLGKHPASVVNQHPKRSTCQRPKLSSLATFSSTALMTS